MLYDYQCQACQSTFEKIYTLAELEKKPVPICPLCGSFKTKKVFLPGHGGIQCDSANDVTWLKSAEEAIKPHHEPPWTSRADYKACLKRNGLQPTG